MTEEDEQGPTGANFAARSARLGELELAGGRQCTTCCSHKLDALRGGGGPPVYEYLLLGAKGDNAIQVTSVSYSHTVIYSLFRFPAHPYPNFKRVSGSAEPRHRR